MYKNIWKEAKQAISADKVQKEEALAKFTKKGDKTFLDTLVTKGEKNCNY